MAEQTFLPVRDSKMQGTPDFAKSLNYGSATSLRHVVLYNGANKTTWERTIVDFDVSALAGTPIVAAKLVREITEVMSAAGPEAELLRCMRPGEWVESQVTWLNYKSGSVWTDAGGDFDETTPAPAAYNEPTGTGTHEIAGLGPFVEDALANRGGIVSLITRLADEDPEEDAGAAWWAKGSPNAWRLVVEYEFPDRGRRTFPEHLHSGPTTRPTRPATLASSTKPTQPTRVQRSYR